VRFQESGLRLYRLGAANFAAVYRDRAVESHVLRFEGNHFHAASRQQSAQPSDHDAFTGVGGGALDHESLRSHGGNFY
jgi:hypothetical protein